MKEIIAKRYAKALFAVIRDEEGAEGLDGTLDAMKALSAAFEQQPHFRHLILNPRFDREEKIGVTKTVLADLQIRGQLMRFCEYLIRKNRFQHLPGISRAYSVLVEQFHGVMTIPVTAAAQPSPQDEEAVRRKLESVTGKKVRLQWKIDPALIGGLIVQVGEARVDGSIRGQLETFKRKFVEA